jgi:alpha/beta superfamily hydrolase
VVRERDITFPSGGLTLEAIFYTAGEEQPPAAIVVCHPHPQYGGDMRNIVVSTVVRGALDAGLGALVFNFRGVGESEGAYDNGAGEREDVRAALSWLRAQPGIERIALAGYSFGASMASHAVDADVGALVLVALPAGMMGGDRGGLAEYEGPVLMISGGMDNISPEATLRQIAHALPSPPEVVIVPNTDHFWWGQERVLSEAVGGFLSRYLGRVAPR